MKAITLTSEQERILLYLQTEFCLEGVELGKLKRQLYDAIRGVAVPLDLVSELRDLMFSAFYAGRYFEYHKAEDVRAELFDKGLERVGL